MDFNVAKQTDGTHFQMFTKGAGTLSFAAPERLSDESCYDERVDVWAIGIVVYMLLVGQHPFECEGSTALLIS